MMFSNLDRIITLFYSNVVMHSGQQVNKLKTTYRASFRQRVTAAMVLLAVAVLFGMLVLAAQDKIDMDRWLNPCGFKQEYDLPCPTCSITTAAVAFAGGKVFESFYIQPAGALLCCVLVVSAFLAFLIAVFGVYFGFLKRFFAEVKVRYIILVLILIIAAGWAVTLARAANN